MKIIQKYLLFLILAVFCSCQNREQESSSNDIQPDSVRIEEFFMMNDTIFIKRETENKGRISFCRILKKAYAGRGRRPCQTFIHNANHFI
ncbi:MAG: hypothetical protein ACJAWV_004186 [Flammeovirgaceae bacterium]|jgi:hypothetical protein